MASKYVVQIIQKNAGCRFPAALLEAILQWVLILILFIDGLLFLVATEFARFFGLDMPCIHCTRIDHVLVNRNPDFCYKESICHNHAKEISSLVYCRLHHRLSNSQRLCCNCIASLSPHEIQSKLDCQEKCNRIRTCSCCSGPLKTQILPDGTEVPERVAANEDWCGIDGSSHVGYKDLSLISSDTESETFETDDSCHGGRSESDVEKDHKKSASEASSILVPQEQLCLIEEPSGPDVNESESSSLGHGLDELRWDKSLSSQLSGLAYPENASEAAVGPNEMNRGNHKATKSFDLDEAYAIAMKSKASGPYRRSVSALPRACSTPTPVKPPILRKRSSMGRWATTRDRAVVESLKGGSMGKVHWKSLLHRLKRQVCLDRKSLIALSSELDQERSASAVAANQAMAMITRLQEEKAAVRMEALQYQRMMEEQVEYDQEALEVMSDLLIKREKKIRLLEEKLDAFNEKFQFEDASNGGAAEGGSYAVEFDCNKELTNDDLKKLRSCSNSLSDSWRSHSCRSLGIIEENDGENDQN